MWARVCGRWQSILAKFKRGDTCFLKLEWNSKVVILRSESIAERSLGMCWAKASISLGVHRFQSSVWGKIGTPCIYTGKTYREKYFWESGRTNSVPDSNKNVDMAFMDGSSCLINISELFKQDRNDEELFFSNDEIRGFLNKWPMQVTVSGELISLPSPNIESECWLIPYAVRD